MEDLNPLEQREILRSSSERRRDLLISTGLLFVVFLFHWPALGDGLFLTDHWQQVAARHFGWGLADQTRAGTYELPGQIMEFWWQDRPLQWRSPHPLAMLLLKAEYAMSGGRPGMLHLFGLLWHAATAALVYHLARWMGLDRRWAFVAGALFVLNPHSVVTASWISGQHAVIGGCFLTAAVFCYVMASAVERTRRSRRSHRLYQVGWSQVHVGWLVLATVLWILALACHETAIVFPLIVFLVDLGYGRRNLVVYRLPVHAVFWSLALAYLYWRFLLFPLGATAAAGWSIPPGTSPVFFALSRLIQGVFCVFFWSPMVMGIATGGTLTTQHVLVHMVMFVLIVTLLAIYTYVTRSLRCRLVWPVWAIAGTLPALLGFLLPEYGYVSFVGCAVMGGLILSRLPQRARLAVTSMVVLATLWPFGMYRILWRGLVRSEQLVYADIIQGTEPPPPAGSKLFFINLPMTAVNAPLVLREAWGMQDLIVPPDLEGHVLTFSPHPLLMDQPCVVEQIGDYEIEISTPGPGYFSHAAGRMLLDATRRGGALQTGTLVQGKVFNVTVLDADEMGIRRLRFRFHHPLASRSFYFYICSTERPACRHRFDGQVYPLDEAHERLITEARTGGLDVRRKLARLVLPLAVQMAAPVQRYLDDQAIDSRQAIERIAAWWRSAGGSDLLRQRRAFLDQHRTMLAERQRFVTIAELMHRFIESDLLLTGEPLTPRAHTHTDQQHKTGE